MTETQYLVCRLLNVTYGCMLNIEIKNPDKVCFYVPYMQAGIKAFDDRKDALAYRDRMNEELHNPKKNADGSFTIDTSGATDYVVIDLETRKTIDNEEE